MILPYIKTRPQHRWRTASMLVLAGFAVAALAGCGTSNSSTSSSGTKLGDAANLTVISQFGDTPALQPVLDKLNKAYEAKHPKVKVDIQYLSADDEQKTLPTALSSGSGPDIFDYDAAESALGELSTNGLVHSLDSYVKKYKWRSDMDESILGRATYDGKVYGVPRSGEAVGLFYNQAIFQKYGIEAPTTYDQFIRAANALKAAGVTPIAFGNKDQWPSSHLIGAAIHANTPVATIRSVESLSGKKTWDDSQILQAMNTAEGWAKDGFLTKDFNGVSFDEAFKSFYTGQAGMFIEGTGVTPDIIKNATTAADFKFIPFPMIDTKLKQQAEGGVGGAWAISASSKAPDIAADWINFVHFSPEAEKAWLEAGVLPTTKFDTSSVKIAPLLQENAAVVQAAITGRGLGAWTGFTSSPLVTDAWNGGAQQFLAGKSTAKDFAATLDAALKQARSK